MTVGTPGNRKEKMILSPNHVIRVMANMGHYLLFDMVDEVKVDPQGIFAYSYFSLTIDDSEVHNCFPRPKKKRL